MESNHWHLELQSSALPTELSDLIKMVAGFEPAIRSFADLHLSHLVIPPVSMDRTRFELVTSRLKGAYSTIELAVQ